MVLRSTCLPLWAAQTLPFKTNACPLPAESLPRVCSQNGTVTKWLRPWGCLYQTLGHLASKKEPVLVVFVTPLPSNDIYQPPTPAQCCMRHLAGRSQSGCDPSGIRSLANAARLTLFFLNITRAAGGTRTRGWKPSWGHEVRRWHRYCFLQSACRFRKHQMSAGQSSQYIWFGEVLKSQSILPSLYPPMSSQFSKGICQKKKWALSF